MEDIEEILNNRIIKKIFRVKNYEHVYLLLERYVDSYSKDFIVKKKLQNKLFIIYLSQLENQTKKGNLYERLLCSFIDKPYNREIISYLLSKNINLNYKTTDKLGISLTLPYILANNIEDKDCMQLFLQKLKNSKTIFFRNTFYKNYTDLCRLNIKAGNLEEAYKVFLDTRYKLFNVDYLDLEEVLDKLLLESKVTIKGFNTYQDDLLYQVISTIKYANLNEEDKKALLINILKSKKIKFFNVLNLSFIKEMLDSITYNKFLDYLKKLERNREIILFNISPNFDSTIYLTTLNATLEKQTVLKK